MKKILIIDDHDIVRFGLKSIISSIGVAVDIYESSSIAEALPYLSNKEFDLVITDHGLPDGNGFDILRQYGDKFPFVVFSMHKDNFFINKAKEYGAKGYISKNSDPYEISKVLKMVITKGSSFFPNCTSDDITSIPSFSVNEQKVFEALLANKTIKEIASDYGLAYTTVQTYRSRIFSKMNIQNQKEFLEICIKNDLIQ